MELELHTNISSIEIPDVNEKKETLTSRVSSTLSWVWDALQRSTEDVAKDPAKTIMVYGFSHCHMWDVLNAFQNVRTISRVYDYSIGVPYDLHYNPQGDPLIKCPVARPLTIHRACKSALVNMIVDNYQRRQKDVNAAITPILFCVDTDKNRYPINEQDFVCKNLITYSELRRAYKLCNDPTIDPAIREIAKETFLFAHVQETPNHTYQLTPAAAPWEILNLESAWEAKRLAKGNGDGANKSKWREYLQEILPQTDIFA
jgi:hypothetical protein